MGLIARCELPKEYLGFNVCPRANLILSALSDRIDLFSTQKQDGNYASEFKFSINADGDILGCQIILTHRSLFKLAIATLKSNILTVSILQQVSETEIKPIKSFQLIGEEFQKLLPCHSIRDTFLIITDKYARAYRITDSNDGPELAMKCITIMDKSGKSI